MIAHKQGSIAERNKLHGFYFTLLALLQIKPRTHIALVYADIIFTL
jgi:hypothetical protein